MARASGFDKGLQELTTAQVVWTLIYGTYLMAMWAAAEAEADFGALVPLSSVDNQLNTTAIAREAQTTAAVCSAVVLITISVATVPMELHRRLARDPELERQHMALSSADRERTASLIRWCRVVERVLLTGNVIVVATSLLWSLMLFHRFGPAVLSSHRPLGYTLLTGTPLDTFVYESTVAFAVFTTRRGSLARARIAIASTSVATALLSVVFLPVDTKLLQEYREAMVTVDAVLFGAIIVASGSCPMPRRARVWAARARSLVWRTCRPISCGRRLGAAALTVVEYQRGVRGTGGDSVPASAPGPNVEAGALPDEGWPSDPRLATDMGWMALLAWFLWTPLLTVFSVLFDGFWDRAGLAFFTVNTTRGALALLLVSGMIMQALRSATTRTMLADIQSAAEKKLAEERRVRLLERQREVNAASIQAHKATLGYVMHELRNPIHVMVGSLWVMRDAWPLADEHELTEELNTLERAVHACRVLVDDVLDLRRLREGRMTLAPELCRVSGVVRDAVNHVSRMSAVPVALRLRGSSATLSDLHAVFDPLRVKQVLLNGLTNAVRASLRACPGGRPGLGHGSVLTQPSEVLVEVQYLATYEAVERATLAPTDGAGLAVQREESGRGGLDGVDHASVDSSGESPPREGSDESGVDWSAGSRRTRLPVRRGRVGSGGGCCTEVKWLVLRLVGEEGAEAGAGGPGQHLGQGGGSRGHAQAQGAQSAGVAVGTGTNSGGSAPSEMACPAWLAEELWRRGGGAARGSMSATEIGAGVGGSCGVGAVRSASPRRPSGGRGRGSAGQAGQSVLVGLMEVRVVDEGAGLGGREAEDLFVEFTRRGAAGKGGGGGGDGTDGRAGRSKRRVHARSERGTGLATSAAAVGTGFPLFAASRLSAPGPPPPVSASSEDQRLETSVGAGAGAGPGVGAGASSAGAWLTRGSSERAGGTVSGASRVFVSSQLPEMRPELAVSNGLGLPLSRKLARALGGDVVLVDRAAAAEALGGARAGARGTVFQFRFPVLLDPASSSPALAEETMSPSGGVHEGSTRSRSTNVAGPARDAQALGVPRSERALAPRDLSAQSGGRVDGLSARPTQRPLVVRPPDPPSAGADGTLDTISLSASEGDRQLLPVTVHVLLPLLQGGERTEGRSALGGTEQSALGGTEQSALGGTEQSALGGAEQSAHNGASAGKVAPALLQNGGRRSLPGPLSAAAEAAHMARGGRHGVPVAEGLMHMRDARRLDSQAGLLGATHSGPGGSGSTLAAAAFSSSQVSMVGSDRAIGRRAAPRRPQSSAEALALCAGAGQARCGVDGLPPSGLEGGAPGNGDGWTSGVAASVVASSVETATSAAVGTRALAKSAAATPVPLQGGAALRVLVVDDERSNRRLLGRMLRRCGVTDVTEADDGTAVLELWRASVEEGRPYSLLMLDIVMLEMSGDAALREVQAECAGRGLACPPSVACTGNASESDRAAYTRTGFSAVLPKPFGVEEVAAVVSRLCLQPATPPR